VTLKFAPPAPRRLRGAWLVDRLPLSARWTEATFWNFLHDFSAVPRSRVRRARAAVPRLEAAVRARRLRSDSRSSRAPVRFGRWGRMAPRDDGSGDDRRVTA